MLEDDHKLTGVLSTKLPKYLLVTGLLLLTLLLYFIRRDPHHVLHSYLTAYIFYIGISLGGLFLVLISYLTRAGWSVAIRRIHELLANNLLLLSFLFIPIAFNVPELYHWAEEGAMAHDALLKLKSPYLNQPFFIARSLIYFIIWIGIARYFFTKSVEQDVIGGEENTSILQNKSAICILLFSLSFTFASFDWLMSLSPHWFSTIFGVYIFANATLATLCCTSLILLLLRKFNFLKDIVTIEHYHDIGKLIYGFVIFWAYIAFSQYFLIWYANIPEETTWYLSRLEPSWKLFSILIIVGHFIFPLFAFMSRHAKRNLKIHGCMATFILLMCIFDTYYVVMPTIYPSLHFSSIDILAFLALGSLFLGNLFLNMKKQCLLPIKDPRLTESLNLENH